MKIGNFKADPIGVSARFSATVVWEESDRAPVELFFEVPSEFAAGLSVNPNAFLVAALVPAIEAGEKRILIEGEICPRLRCGLLTIIEILRDWHGRDDEAIALEARAWASRNGRNVPDRAGVFFSGGVDSFATLKKNRLLFPEAHAESFRDAVILYGINFDSDNSPATFARAIEELSIVADEAGVTLIPVRTNLRRDLNPDADLFMRKNHGALLAATAHALDGRLTTMSIASSHHISNITKPWRPWGSHPLVDPYYSSFNMRIQYDGIELTRFAKEKLLADWDLALQSFKICPVQWPGRNCGKCEKCMRTMLALTALGLLARTQSFGATTISPEEIRSIKITKNYAFYYEELLGPLREAGCHDLARAAESVIARAHGETGLFGRLKRIDRLYFSNSLHVLKRNLRGESMNLLARFQRKKEFGESAIRKPI